MKHAIQLMSLLALSAVWLALVIPGYKGEHGVNWESLMMVGFLPVAVLWIIYIVSFLIKRFKK